MFDECIDDLPIVSLCDHSHRLCPIAEDFDSILFQIHIR